MKAGNMKSYKFTDKDDAKCMVIMHTADEIERYMEKIADVAKLEGPIFEDLEEHVQVIVHKIISHFFPTKIAFKPKIRGLCEIHYRDKYSVALEFSRIWFDEDYEGCLNSIVKAMCIDEEYIDINKIAKFEDSDAKEKKK